MKKATESKASAPPVRLEGGAGSEGGEGHQCRQRRGAGGSPPAQQG